MPYCRHCGGFHADDASFCPFCGKPVDDRLTDLPAGEEPPPTGVTNVFGRTLRGLWTRRPWSLLGIAAVAAICVAIVATVGAAATAYASFGTLRFHRIVDTHCFVRTRDLNGTGTSFKIRNGCDILKLHTNVAGLVIVGIIAMLLVLIAWTAFEIMLLRRCDREFGSRQAWPLLPGGRSLVRTVLRVIGWSLVAMGAYGLALGIPIAIVASTAGTGASSGVQAIAILVEVLGIIFLMIWWILPFLFKAGFAWTGMLTDGHPFLAVWRTLSPTRGQLWGFIGLYVLLSLGFSVGTQIVGAIFRALGPLVIVGGLITLAVQLVALVIGAALQVAGYRFFQHSRPGDAG